MKLLLCLLPFLAMADQEPQGRPQFIDASLAYHQAAYDDCITGYMKTIALHHEVPFSKMMIARCLALKGDIDKAMDALDEAAEFEFVGASFCRPIRNLQKYASIPGTPKSSPRSRAIMRGPAARGRGVISSIFGSESGT
jgi:hypothetical protein